MHASNRCLLHQPDLKVKSAVIELLGGSWFSMPNKWVAYLRKQKNLVAEMSSTYPKYTTRWVAMGKITKWNLSNIIRLLRYIDIDFDRSKSHQYPDSIWWIVTSIVDAIVSHINITFVKLQGRHLLVSQQYA